MPFKIVRNDITKMDVDVLVNPTNEDLYGTAGVDGDIHHIEGSWLREFTSTLPELQSGQVLLTEARMLKASHIIHTVGPRWGIDKEGEVILRNCYRNALELAIENGFTSIAFPLISSGSFNWPKELALKVAVDVIGDYLLSHEMMVYLVVYDKKSYHISEDLFDSIESYIDDNYIDEKYSFIDSLLIEESKAAISYSTEKVKKRSLDDLMKQLDESFSQMLLRLIDERGLKDPKVYRKANVTKQTFSKIRNRKDYKPSKATVIAFAIALELSLDETKDLLLKAGYALSNSSRFDVIVTYFLVNESYNIYEVNEVLFEYDEQTLGV